MSRTFCGRLVFPIQFQLVEPLPEFGDVPYLDTTVSETKREVALIVAPVCVEDISNGFWDFGDCPLGYCVE